MRSIYPMRVPHRDACSWSQVLLICWLVCTETYTTWRAHPPGIEALQPLKYLVKQVETTPRHHTPIRYACIHDSAPRSLGTRCGLCGGKTLASTVIPLPCYPSACMARAYTPYRLLWMSRYECVGLYRCGWVYFVAVIFPNPQLDPERAGVIKHALSFLQFCLFLF